VGIEEISDFSGKDTHRARENHLEVRMEEHRVSRVFAEHASCFMLHIYKQKRH